MKRIDYVSKAVQYIGTTDEYADVNALPTGGIADGSVFLWVDTSTTAIFYNGTWYEQA